MRYLLWLVALLVAVPVSAQPLKIHDHPQKAAYASPAEWPVRDAQCHADPGNLNPKPMPPLVEPGIALLSPTIAHGSHFKCGLPEQAEVGGPFRVHCAIMMYRVAGVNAGIYSTLNQIRDIVYEDTGTSTPPVMRGDPASMMPQVWNVSFTFDPLMPSPLFPPTFTTKHGYFTGKVDALTRFDNGDTVQAERIFTLYSVIDPTAPETPPSDSGLPNGTGCAPNNKRRPELSLPGNQHGSIIVEAVTPLPIAPISAPFPVIVDPYNYAALEGLPSSSTFAFPDGTFEMRYDMDVHGGKVGRLIQTKQFKANGGSNRVPVTIDPADLGSGTHKVTLLWWQPDGQGNNYTSLLAFDVTVGPGVPVPTLCTDTNAPNFGGPAPCLPPVPVDVCPNLDGVQTTVPMGLVLVNGQCVPPVVTPTETWDIFTPIFRLNSKDPTRMQVCRAADPMTCKELFK